MDIKTFTENTLSLLFIPALLIIALLLVIDMIGEIKDQKDIED